MDRALDWGPGFLRERERKYYPLMKIVLPMFSVLLSCLCASIEKGWNFKLEKATLKSFLVFANDVIHC